MAAQFDTAKVVVQPTEQAQPIPTDVFSAGAGVFGQQSATLDQEASTQGQKSQVYFSQANAAFDKALEVYNKVAEENGARDATGIIKKDGNGLLVPPSSFYPPGIASRSYAESYRKTAEAIYKQSAETQFQGHVAEAQSRFPNDVAGFNAYLEPHRQAMLTGLDTDFKPFLDVRFQQMAGQAATQISVNVQSEKNRVADKNANDAYAGIAVDASKLAGWSVSPGSVALTGPQTIEKAGTLIANDSVMQQRLAQAEALARSAGWGEARIAEQRKELAYNTVVSVYREGFRGITMITPDGKYDFEKEKEIRAQVARIAANFPDRKEHFEQEVLKGVAFGQQQSQLAAQGKQQRDITYGQNEQRGIAEEAERIRLLGRNPNMGTEEALEVQRRTRALEDKSLAYLTNKNLSDSVALQLAGYATQQGAIGKQVYAEATNNRLVDMRQLGLGPTSTPEQRLNAEQQTGQILSSPEMRQLMSPEQRSYAQQSLNAMQLRRLQGDQVGLMAEASAGKIDLETANTAVQNGIRNGTMEPATGLRILQTAAVAFTAKQAREGGAISAMQTHAAGGKITDEQYKNWVETNPYSPPGAKPEDRVTNISNPAHVAYAMDRYRRIGRVDPEFKAAMNAMPRVADEGSYAPYASAFTQMVNAADQLGYKDEAGFSQVANQLGDSVVNFHRLAANRGLEYAVDFDNKKGNSQTGQQGNPTQQSDQNLDKAIDQTIDQLSAANARKDWLARNLGMGLDADQQRAQALFGEKSGPLTDAARRPAPTSYAATEAARSATTVGISPTVRQIIAEEAGTMKTLEGKTLAAIPPGDVDSYLVRRAMDRNADRFERRMVDPTRPELGEVYDLKGFETDRAKALNIPSLSQAASQGLKLGILAAKTGKSAQSIWAQYDPNTVAFDPIIDKFGNELWNVTARQGGNIVGLTQIRKDDPILGQLTSQIARTTATEAAVWFPGDTTKQTFFGQMFGHFITDPAYRHVRNEKIEGELRALNKTPGWEDSFVDAVHGVRDAWYAVTGQAPTPKNQQEWLNVEAAGRKGDSALVAQIKRYGLLHALFRPTPEEGLLPPVGQPARDLRGMPSDGSTRPPGTIESPLLSSGLQGGRPGFATGLQMKPYQPYAGPLYTTQDAVRSPNDVEAERAALAATAPAESPGEAAALKRKFGGQRFGASAVQ